MLARGTPAHACPKIRVIMTPTSIQAILDRHSETVSQVRPCNYSGKMMTIVPRSGMNSDFLSNFPNQRTILKRRSNSPVHIPCRTECHRSRWRLRHGRHCLSREAPERTCVPAHLRCRRLCTGVHRNSARSPQAVRSVSHILHTHTLLLAYSVLFLLEISRSVTSVNDLL